MEIDVTRFVTEADPYDFSASILERGPNAGRETWNEAKEAAADIYPLLVTEQELETARDWFGEFGAWEDDEERAAWSPAEINALLIQFISGDLREAESLANGDGPGGIDWNAYRELQEAGTCSSYLFLADDGRVFFYLGS